MGSQFVEADHPRAATGQFAEKVNSAPVALTGSRVVVEVPTAPAATRTCYYECGDPIEDGDLEVVIVPGDESPAHTVCHDAATSAEEAMWRSAYDARPRRQVPTVAQAQARADIVTERIFQRVDDLGD